MDDERREEQMSMPAEPEATASDGQAGDADTAGFAMGSPSALLWRIAPELALRRTLPDPPPERWEQQFRVEIQGRQ